MAREFNGTTQFLNQIYVPVSDGPLSMACWFNTTDLTTNQGLVTIVDNSTNGDFWHLFTWGTEAGDPIGMQERGSLGGGIAKSTSGYSSGVWHHACGVISNSSERYAYIDGGSKGSEFTASGGVEDVDRTSIGHMDRQGTTGDFFTGSIAEVGIWNKALNEEEVAILGAGYSPLAVAPHYLTFYMPLVRGNLGDLETNDLIGGIAFNAATGPAVTAHPRVFYLAPQTVSPLSGIITPDVVWGHDTGVIEPTIRDFSGNWAGTGAVVGSGDAEYLELNAGENMVSEVVDTGIYTVTLLQNNYDPSGDDVDMDYRHGATEAACLVAGWNNYTVPFTSLGYVQVKMTSTL